MSRPTIFLDIDGVLNRHVPHGNGYCGILPDCVEHLNTILDAVPDAVIVVSSAWRYMVLKCAMTCRGFEYLRLVCGVNFWNRVEGCTVLDEDVAGRAEQIRAYAEKHGAFPFVVIDDIDFAMPEQVKCDPGTGLTAELADCAVKMLKGESV
jgi:hypothetical protein